MIARALEIAAGAHFGQTDKGGEEYIMHPLAVMQLAASYVPLKAENFKRDVMIVALLHDVLEDCPAHDKAIYQGQIRSEFGPTVWEAVMRLTKKPGEDYSAYIEQVAQDPIARLVKIADLTHNMDTGRLPEGDIGEKDYTRWDKYRRALVRLKRED